MVIYRVEHCLDSNQGPYCTMRLSDAIVEELDTYNNYLLFNHTDNNHPNLIFDSTASNKRKDVDLLWKNGEIFFGFKSIKQYKEWFNSKERKILHLVGFNLVKYEVSSRYVVVLSKQLVFIKDIATIIKIIKPGNSTKYELSLDEIGIINVNEKKI